jgi:hypothetical protein
MKKVNGFDIVFEAVYNGVTKTKNYNLVLECKDSTELLTFFLQHLLDINNYFNLYKHAFIPAANKSVALTKNEYAHSRYKDLINAKGLDLKENLYETIRLGYVGLFHKIEGYTKDIRKNNSLIKRAYEIEGDFDIVSYMQKKLGVDFLNPVLVSKLNKIRIISNAVKHNNGFPQVAQRDTDDIKKYIANQTMNSKINIEPDILLQDIKSVIEYFTDVNVIVNVFVLLYLSDGYDLKETELEIKKRKLIDTYSRLVGLYCS